MERRTIGFYEVGKIYLEFRGCFLLLWWCMLICGVCLVMCFDYVGEYEYAYGGLRLNIYVFIYISVF